MYEMENDLIVENMLRKRKYGAKSGESSEINTTVKNPFLSNSSRTLPNNKEIFDTLSDVSTDDSDIQIIHESRSHSSIKNKVTNKISNFNNKTVIVLDSNSDTENVPHTFNKSIDYLTLATNCDIVQEIDYLKCDTHLSPPLDSHSVDSDSSNSALEVIQLDNDVSFVIDNASTINLTEIEIKKNKDDSKETNGKSKHKRKRKSEKRFPNNPELRNDPRMFKYWSQRYDLFERFDMGIKLDKESWYSVTAEYIAKEQASLCKETDTVLDAFCGAGGNTIQFAYKCKKVLALDIDPSKIELTKHNCDVYGVDKEKVSIMKDDFYSFANVYKSSQDPSSLISMPPIDVVFLSPPWGGQNYLIPEESVTNTINIGKMMTAARIFRPKSIIVYLPRNTDQAQLNQFLQPNETIDIIHHESRYKKVNNKKVKAITVVYRSN